ncbi:abc56ffe-d295-4e70-baa9-503f5fc4b646 [Sclerotinia trifoliorum]|uniref:Abc56ffe-d295-4e70-baa9-503f5fc4b646 n=1 Tax=Sclerotinia trifoliorum TaxID=28548 RepID=A0A8H2W1C7_9HELO|nr:abc56ffe-d295-4e70-baa9-503f5fc4b646 [Sclerotinia trifoliorum]
MVQLDTPASELRKPITSPFAGGMTPAELERLLQTTPQMSRFNPSRRRLRALKTPDARTSKGEIVITSDQVVTASISSPIVHPPVSLIREDPGEGINKPTADVRANDVQGSVSKSTDSICSPCREDSSRSKQQGETFPKRFLKTIAKRKQLRRGERKESKVSTSLPVEETLSKFLSGEKSDQQAGFSSRGSGGMARVDTPTIGSEPLSGETTGDSQESTSLEEIIRTAPRTSTSQAMDNFAPCYVSLSFGPARLVRRANMSLDNEDDDGDDDLNDLEVAILGLSDSNDPSKSMPGPDDSNGADINPKSRTGRLDRQKQKKEKKMPRRLPIDELYLVSERVEELTQEDDVESVQYLGELPDDPISQDASDALQVINTVGRTKRKLNTLQKWSCGAFGKIDTRKFRFPKLESTSPQARKDNRREVRPSHSDGFVGSEADSTGQFMLVPKHKRVNISIWGLTTRVAQLQLAREKDYGLGEESNGQIKKRTSARKSKRPPHKQAKVNVPVFIEPKARAVETGDAQQKDQCNQNHQDHDSEQKYRQMNGYVADDGIIPNAGNESPLALHRKACRGVTFDERLDDNQRARPHSSNSLVGRDMEMALSQSCHRGECEEDGPLWHESERSVVSISSDDDDPEESDETSDNSSEELDDGQQMEGDSDAQTTSGEDVDSQSDATSISVSEEPSEVSDNSQNSDGEIDEESEDEEDEDEKGEYSTVQAVLEEEMNKQSDEGRVFTGSPSGEEIATASLLGGSNQHKENFPFEDLLLEGFQRTEADAIKENDDIEPSRLSVDMSPELGKSQVTDLSNELENSMIDAMPPDNLQNFLPHFSQLSFIPEDIPEESYFYRVSQTLRGNFERPKSRVKSTPARFYPEHNKAIVTPALIQPSTETTASVFSAPRTSPKFSQQSYRPTPRSEKSLSRLTRQASFAFGTLPVSARKRTKTLPFVPPFKKPTLQI